MIAGLMCPPEMFIVTVTAIAYARPHAAAIPPSESAPSW